MTSQEERARAILMRLLPDHMGYAPIGSPAGTGYALAAMLALAAEVREGAAKVAEEMPSFQLLPDKVIPAYADTDDYGNETGFVWRERVQKRKRLTRGADIAAAIRAQGGGQ